MLRTVLALILSGAVSLLQAQDEHAGLNLTSEFGKVHFEISCNPSAQQQFDRSVAMLHSFFYPETEKAFQAVEKEARLARWRTGVLPSVNTESAYGAVSARALEAGMGGHPEGSCCVSTDTT